MKRGKCSVIVDLAHSPGKEFAARATNIFVSQILRKLDLGVSNYVKQSAGDNGTSVKVLWPKDFQNNSS